MYQEINHQLLSFIEQSPSCYQAIAQIEAHLQEASFSSLSWGEEWHLTSDRGYYVTRNGSSLIAFRIPKETPVGFQIIASHSDSPAFKIKENPGMVAEGHYTRLNVEKYGGMLMAPWLDRPLSVAGRLVVRTEKGIALRLANI